MKRFFFLGGQPRAIIQHCVPVVEELESRRLLAAMTAGSLLPAVIGPTAAQGQTARLANTPTQASTGTAFVGPTAPPATGSNTGTTQPHVPLTGTPAGTTQPAATTGSTPPTVPITSTGSQTGQISGQGGQSSFFPPPSFFNPVTGPTVATGFAPAATTGALPFGSLSSAGSINFLTPQQALAQRAAILTPSPAPPPAYAYGEGMFIYVAPLELPPPNNPVTTENNAMSSLENSPPAEESAVAKQAGADWQAALNAYFAEVGDW